jgi:hypothetical protein
MNHVELGAPLGSFEKREEFQIDRTIVQVQIPPDGERLAWLQRAGAVFPDIWAAVPNVLALAEKILQPQLAGFATGHDDEDGRLSVWGIWIDPTDGSAGYEVGCYNPFDSNDPAAPPGLPDQIDVMIERDATGQIRRRGELQSGS